MNPEERARMMELCALLKDEQDPVKFIVLVTELNDLLAGRQTRLQLKRDLN